MNKFLKINPEFARNLWLEFSPQRLIIMPVIIFLIAGLIVMNVHEDAFRPLHYTATAIFSVLAIIWGMKTSSDSIIEEYNDKTWDWQRMSAIGPWKLAWGKLFGATGYQWYGAAMAMFLYFITCPGFEDPGKEFMMGIVMILGAITMHGLMMLFSLQMIKKGDGRAKIRGARVYILGIFFVFFIVSPLNSLYEGVYSGRALLNWYGISGAVNIAFFTVLFYGSWIVAGVYRSMRAELQYSDRPAYWVAFLLSSVVFSFGYFADMPLLTISGKVTSTFIAVFFQMLVFTYFLAISEPKDIVNFRLIISAYRSKDWDTFWRNIPLWPVTFAFLVLTGLIAAAFSTAAIGDTASMYGLRFDNLIEGKIFLIYIAVIAFVVRDLCIMLLLNMAPRRRRADGAMILYLAVLYFLLPAITYKFSISALFYPNLTVNAGLMVIIPVIEAAVAAVVLVRRWQELERETRLLA